jgi:hypothetical protein
VAISADGNTLAIGGFLDNGGIGAVWIFTRASGAWTQQGSKLVGTGAAGTAGQGGAVALSGDGNTLAIGGNNDNGGVGAVWIFTRASGAWTQQGSKLVGTASAGSLIAQGDAVALSSDGSTLLEGGPDDNDVGAAWVFTRSGTTWTQQGAKLTSSSASGLAGLGEAVALSSDGNTALLGGGHDSSGVGAAWVFTRSGSTWTQQGNKLIGTGAVGPASQGTAVALSGDGNTAVIGGLLDNSEAGATWVFTRTSGAWNQLGNKLAGSGATGAAGQGRAVAISTDASTVIVGGNQDNSDAGAVWIFSTQASAPNVPSAVSVSPAFGSASATTLTFTFSDTGGFQALTVLDILINSSLDGRHACYIAFVPASSTVDLVDDAGDAGGPYSAITLPGTGTAQNSQCTITGAGSSVSGTGNTLTLTLAMSFTASFAGNKVIYMAAQDASANSGWQALGTWNVPGSAPTGPSVTGVTPGNSKSLTQTYIFNFADTNGWQDLAVLNILVNSAIDGRHACYIAYVPAGASTGAVDLVDDAGDAGGPYSAFMIPGTGTASNSQCSIAGTGATVTASGNNLTLTLPITFTTAFAGNQIVFLAARSNTQNSGWQAVGTVQVPSH